MLVPVSGNLTVFYIDVVSENPGRYTVEVVEFGSEGRPSLEPGLPFFDQFTSTFSLNCYRLQGALDEKHPLQVSFVYSEALRQKLHSQNITSKEVNPTFFYDWKPVGQDVLRRPSPDCFRPSTSIKVLSTRLRTVRLVHALLRKPQ